VPFVFFVVKDFEISTLNDSSHLPASPWPHRLAVVLACATFPLVWVGGLVTTTNSGMAVPDWPTTYGYNMFLYPWQSWLRGPWGLFFEHGHRLLASSVGMLTIALLVVVLLSDDRRWMKVMAFAALGLVIFQGLLGGMRVRLDDRTFAMLHGFTGPLFFAVTVAMVVFTSRTWRSNSPQFVTNSASNIRLLAIATAVLAYLQIVLGAVLRHIPVDALPSTFILAVKSHLFLAAVLSIHVVSLATFIWLRARAARPLGGLAFMLVSLICCQIALGAGTWVVKYSVPTWAQAWVDPPSVSVQEGGAMQTHMITAHVAIGSLIFGTSVALALFAQRLLARPMASKQIVRGKLGAAI
jgi:cytochrome c oxidase assembly protein subunit 15